MHQAKTAAHVCKSCGHSFEGKFCNRCGEKVYDDHDKSLTHFLEEGFHFITHFEGTFFTTLKAITSRPGLLSTDYCNGIRRKYFKPVSFFLLLVVLYLIFPFFPGLNMPMAYHKPQALYGAYAERRINNFLAEHPSVTEEQLAAKFAVKSEKTSKILLFIIIPACGLLFWLLARQRRPYLFDHLILATEFNSFFLLFSFFIMPLVFTLVHLIARQFSGGIRLNDGFLTVGEYVVLSIFLSIAVKRFYALTGLRRAGFVLVSLFWHAFVVYFFYKWLLFVTTFAQISA